MNARLQSVPALLALLLLCQPITAADIAPIERVLPPVGLEIPADTRSRLESRLAETKKRLESVTDRVLKPDIEIFTKAVEYALLHREFYVERDFRKADWALDEANKRLDALASNESPWTKSTGLVVEGYRSSIDNSAQPYGLVIPENHDLTKPCPLYVWLHGRGDKNTDLHFLNERATRPGQITPPGAIVMHAFGRQCVGYKSAGERDVHEATASVMRRYKIDNRRVVLMGFSMGGAGAWQVGAHSASNWVAISPGAGFVDVLRYQRLDPEKIPEYEKKLWGVNDVPDYVRNLFNTNVIAYSGELDKQRAAAVMMEEAFENEGRKLTHLIGPGVEHKYEPATLAELLKRLEAAVAKGRDVYPSEVHFQTRTLRYFRQAWVTVDELEEHWQNSRIDAKRSGDKFDVQTKNIRCFALTLVSANYLGADTSQAQFVIDGQQVTRSDGPRQFATFVKRDGKWQGTPGSESFTSGKLRKVRMSQGPIDDAFVNPFVVVTPSGKSKNARFQAWVDFELAHLRDRWRALMRGDLPEVKDTEFDSRYGNNELNVVLFGDPDSNAVMAKLLKDAPAKFADGKWTLGNQTYDGNRYVPALTFPRRFEHAQYPNYTFKYVVCNSGLTFREGHDRTNSLQNPKLPDWAIIDFTQPPDNMAPGRIHDADFFNESWQLKRQPLAAQP